MRIQQVLLAGLALVLCWTVAYVAYESAAADTAPQPRPARVREAARAVAAAQAAGAAAPPMPASAAAGAAATGQRREFASTWGDAKVLGTSASDNEVSRGDQSGSDVLPASASDNDLSWGDQSVSDVLDASASDNEADWPAWAQSETPAAEEAAAARRDVVAARIVAGEAKMVPIRWANDDGDESRAKAATRDDDSANDSAGDETEEELPASKDPPIFVRSDAPRYNFTLINYRALESALAVFPTAPLRHVLVAPQYAVGYMFADALVGPQFERYRRLGRDWRFLLINAQPVERVVWMLGSSDSVHPGRIPGRVWWTRHRTCLSGAGNIPMMEMAKQKKQLTPPLANDAVLALALYVYGGTFIDGSFAVTKRPARPIYLTSRWFCPNKRPVSRFANFPESHHALPRCVLVALDVFADTLLQTCQKQPSTMSATEQYGSTREAYESAMRGAFLFAREMGIAESPHLVAERLAPLTDAVLVHCVGAATLSAHVGLTPGPSCGDALWRACATILADSGDDDDDDGSATSDDDGAPDVEPNTGRAQAESAWCRADGPALAADGAAVWLGASLAYSSEWRDVDDEPALAPFALPRFVPPAPRQPVLPCHPLPPPYPDTGKCAPHFLVAGFEKAASTFLFAQLARHPAVVRPLAGSGFKEAGFFFHKHPRFEDWDTPAHVARHMPPLRAGDGLVFGDGLVYYGMNFEAPFRARTANPHMRVLFSVREPVERLWSRYRFIFHGYSARKMKFRDIVDTKVGDCLAPNGTALPPDNTTLDAFYGRNPLCHGKLPTVGFDNPMRNTLYVYPIAHWMNVLGRNNVKVVFKEELTRDPAGVLADCFDFLGLWHPERLNETKSTVANKSKDPTKIPPELAITDADGAELRAFFEPFDRALADLLGRSLPWQVESSTPAPAPAQPAPAPAPAQPAPAPAPAQPAPAPAPALPPATEPSKKKKKKRRNKKNGKLR